MFGFSFSTVKSIPEAYTPASLRNTAFFKNKNAEKPFGLSFSVFLPSESQAHKLNYTPARKCLVLGFQWLLNHVQIGFKKLGQYSSDILPIHHDRTIQQLIKIQLAGNVVFLKWTNKYLTQLPSVTSWWRLRHPSKKHMCKSTSYSNLTAILVGGSIHEKYPPKMNMSPEMEPFHIICWAASFSRFHGSTLQ